VIQQIRQRQSGRKEILLTKYNRFEHQPNKTVKPEFDSNEHSDALELQEQAPVSLAQSTLSKNVNHSFNTSSFTAFSSRRGNSETRFTISTLVGRSAFLNKTIIQSRLIKREIDRLTAKRRKRGSYSASRCGGECIFRKGVQALPNDTFAVCGD
jgi:hypothetical protein